MTTEGRREPIREALAREIVTRLGVSYFGVRLERDERERAIGEVLEMLRGEAAPTPPLDDLVRTARHYLNPDDWGVPVGDANQRSFLIAAIHHLGTARDTFRVAYEAKAEAAATPAPQDDDGDLVAKITAVVREADEGFRKSGGGSRHWVRDWFLPVLNRAGLSVSKAAAVAPDSLKLVRQRLFDWGWYRDNAAPAESEVLDVIAAFDRWMAEAAPTPAPQTPNTCLVPSEWRTALDWRERFLDSEREEELTPLDPQIVCYLIADRMEMERLHGEIAPRISASKLAPPTEASTPAPVYERIDDTSATLPVVRGEEVAQATGARAGAITPAPVTQTCATCQFWRREAPNYGDCVNEVVLAAASAYSTEAVRFSSRPAFSCAEYAPSEASAPSSPTKRGVDGGVARTTCPKCGRSCAVFLIADSAHAEAPQDVWRCTNCDYDFGPSEAARVKAAPSSPQQEER